VRLSLHNNRFERTASGSLRVYPVVRSSSLTDTSVMVSRRGFRPKFRVIVDTRSGPARLVVRIGAITTFGRRVGSAAVVDDLIDSFIGAPSRFGPKCRGL